MIEISVIPEKKSKKGYAIILPSSLSSQDFFLFKINYPQYLNGIIKKVLSKKITYTFDIEILLTSLGLSNEE